MPDEIRRKRSAFIGRGVSVSPPRPTNPQPTQQQSPPPQRPAPNNPTRDAGQRQYVEQQVQQSKRRRLTADSGFASSHDTPVMDQQEVEDFLAEAERREPGSHVRGSQDTGSMAVGGPGYREPKPGV